MKFSIGGLTIIILIGLGCSDQGSEPNPGPQNRAPSIISSANATAFETVRFIYRAYASDPDGTIPTIAFSDYPAWLEASGDTVFGTPLVGTPDTSFSVIASDGSLADTLLVSVIVTDTSQTVNQAPHVTSPDTATATENQAFRYIAHAEDPDGTMPAISFGNYAGWLSVTDDTLSGTPPTGSADTSFSVFASDGLLSDTLVVHVTIVSAPPGISYASQVQPIFTANCALSGCHGMGMTPAGGLRLINYNSLMSGGDSGQVIIPFQPDSSFLVKRIEGTVQPQMPYLRPPLPDSSIQIIRDWISQGAQDN